jgi:hypothetical protein
LQDEALLRFVLQQRDADIEGDGIKAAGKHDARAVQMGGFVMCLDHLAHPGRFAAQIDIARTGLHAGVDQTRSIELIGANRGQHDLGRPGERSEGRGIIVIGFDQRRIGVCGDFVAHGGKLVA